MGYALRDMRSNRLSCSRAVRIIRFHLIDGDLYMRDGVEIPPVTEPDEVRSPIATTIEQARTVLSRELTPLDRCEAALRMPCGALKKLVSEGHAANMRIVARRLQPDLKMEARRDRVSMRDLFYLAGAEELEEQRARWNRLLFGQRPPPKPRKRSATG